MTLVDTADLPDAQKTVMTLSIRAASNNVYGKSNMRKNSGMIHQQKE